MWKNTNHLSKIILVIFLYFGNKGYGKYTLVSIDDFERIKNVKWHLQNNGYAENSKLGLLR